jgi:hypothetical protein
MDNLERRVIQKGVKRRKAKRVQDIVEELRKGWD